VSEKEKSIKQAMQTALGAFASHSLEQASIGLLNILGYKSDRRILLRPNLPPTFVETFTQGRPFNTDQALLSEWQTVDCLFQLTDSEIQGATQGELPFLSKGAFDGAVMESYLFFAIELAGDRYTRTKLAGITRAINRLFNMPVMLIFKHGETITLSIIRRRLHKRDESKDVIEKVTLIKDIRCTDPHRAHIDILADLALAALYKDFYFHNFAGLHTAWEKRLDSYVLNERFYREIADWHFWALRYPGVVYPRDVKSEEGRAIFLIRLLTRLIFCWFLQEKGLIPRDLFRDHYVKDMLKDSSASAGTYYKAFLQNLFFATLNQEQDKRAFRHKYEGTRDGNRGITNLYRYANLLNDTDPFLRLLGQVPFVNGGLFDCLDVVYDQKAKPNIRLDDFSEEKGNALQMPNELFFGTEREVDLTEVYQDKRHKKEHVRGLIDILSRYKFTVEENTPLEQEIALDPELLGKVFENLLASYNEDTKTTARKATGSFYTPREIVNYMVDEALETYLQTAILGAHGGTDNFKTDLQVLFKGEPVSFSNPFSEDDTTALIAAIDGVKILDPACGSGAFPMGALYRLVDLLQKLDPNNRRWKEQQLAKAKADRRLAERMQDDENRRNALEDVEARIADIEQSFNSRFHALDFARKLYLIENCLYGVDIQPTACQIAKLRFFIALIVDQNVDDEAPNRGVRPLPNLETKIVAADTLVPIKRKIVQGDMFREDSSLVTQIDKLRQALEQIRHEYFGARTPARKRKCREQDETLREKIAALLKETGLEAPIAKILASWDPYDQNAHAGFFDPEWMFGIPVGRGVSRSSRGTLLSRLNLINETDGQMELADAPPPLETGFDIVIGNPPYVRIQTLKQKDADMARFLREHYVSASKGNYDVYVVFVERGLQLLKSTGNLAYILPHKFFNAQYGEPLRGLIAKGKHLRHVVHFGDQQVFPGSTNYVCLMFLQKMPSNFLRFVEAANLPQWLRANTGSERTIPVKDISKNAWVFVVGNRAVVFDKLSCTENRLGDLARHIAQGIRTSANEVYVLDVVEDHGDIIAVRSASLNRIVMIERAATRPFLQGREIKPYAIRPSAKVVIIPYSFEEERIRLSSARSLKAQHPRAFAYLEENRERLENREDGKMRGIKWYGFVYPKNLEVMVLPKLLVPDIADRASFALDYRGLYAFTSGYGITLKSAADVSLKYVLAIANSLAATFYWRHISTPLRGGFYRYFTQFISQLPIPTASGSQQELICLLTDYLLCLHGQAIGEQEVSGHLASRDSLMLGYFEQVVNGLIYELFFPEELHNHKLFLFGIVEEAKLPVLEDIQESQRLAILRETFERTYDLNHPLRGALHALQSVELVRIIEDKA
jgi:adenine-specific DNA-methyltransferase